MNKIASTTLAFGVLAAAASAQITTGTLTPPSTGVNGVSSQAFEANELNWTDARYWVNGAYSFSGITPTVPGSVNNSNTSLVRAPSVGATNWTTLAAGNSVAFTPRVVAPWSPWVTPSGTAQYISSNTGLDIPFTTGNPSNPIGTIRDGQTFDDLGLAINDFRPASNLAGNYQFTLTLPALPSLPSGQFYTGNVNISLQFSSDNRAGVLFDVGGVVDATADFGGTIGTLTSASVAVDHVAYQANTNQIVLLVRNSATTDATAPTLPNRPWSNPTGLLVQSIVVEYSVIPEPSTWALIAGLGAIGLALLRRRK